MDFFTAIKERRSVRVYTEKAIPDEVIKNALQAALLAPNSSNMQTCEIYRVKSKTIKDQLTQACLEQSAAKTAQELIVFVATTKHWKRNADALAENAKKTGAPQRVFDYYKKLMPIFYGYQFLNPIKYIIFNFVGLFKAVPRISFRFSAIQEVTIKSAALACENFMLAISAQGFDTCPMEGFDEIKVKKILNLDSPDRVVMVISVGERSPDGVWGEQFRLPREWFVFEK